MSQHTRAQVHEPTDEQTDAHMHTDTHTSHTDTNTMVRRVLKQVKICRVFSQAVAGPSV